MSSSMMMMMGVKGEGIELLYKTILTRTDVTNQALLALDLRDMATSCNSLDVAEAENIYMNGKNSPRVDRFGKQMAKKRSLSQFVEEEGDPTRSLTWVWAMLGSSANVKEADAIETSFSTNAGEYDLEVRSLFSNAALEKSRDKCLLAVEAATVFNLWFHASFELWDSFYDCAFSSKKGYNSDADAMHDNDNGALAMDEFIAYWVGAGVDDKQKSGTALYNLAYNAAEEWNTKDPITAQPKAHVKIQQLYEEAAGLALSQQGACTSSNPNTLPHLWSLVTRIQSQMYIPLIQELISAIANKDTDRTGVYSHAFIPQLVQCPASKFKTLKEVFLNPKEPPNPNENFVQDQIANIHALLDCLGLTCEDIGFTGKIPMCSSDPSPNLPLAQFQPTSNILQQSKMDLDIYQMHLLMMVEFSSDVWDFVEHYYRFGKNSILDDTTMELRSLQSLAKSKQRKLAVPYYELYEKYFDDASYADTVIMNTLQAADSKWFNSPRAAKRKIVEVTLQSQVLFMHVLSELSDLSNDCKNKTPFDNDGNANSLDEVAAYVIGYMEGPTSGGSGDGVLHWSLANQRSISFNTYSKGGSSSQVNVNLKNLLFSARGELRVFDCDALEKTVEKITSDLLIPIYQSVIFYADVNEEIDAFMGSPNMGNAQFHTEEDIAAGEAYAQALLPILSAASPESAKIVHDNMITIRGLKPVKDKAQGVANALATTLNYYKLSCVDIGLRDDADICQNYVAPTSPPVTVPPEKASNAFSYTYSYCIATSLILTTVWILYP